ncbi:type 1 glutamine amidotransferase [Phycicoccus sp. MAQZ13P-2]|uniref:type 1 glutamine amidotransferase n=1 Tax=Phycicoccus mangrovi TaxID=2840470 RepID=UPI001C001A15|nr:type 1 glutamine amidotransferase [Phycicoccus mangrovi]MBT9253997.1 type 1 glutamine amidotransferase [Phycicoccus mangrovi]MBT9275590.1 type 1 glutamine amidotransferase [Phycicoccus mangrovi]
MPRLLVVQHEPDAPPAWLGEWWAALGVGLDVVRGDLGEPVPARLADGGHNGLVVLGGAMGANDDAEHPWLAPTKALLRDTARAGEPVLGVCLGHQLAAVALGGRAGRNPSGRTIGVAPVALTREGAADPLLGGSAGAPAVHYNDDVVLDLPPGATVLATLPDGRPQALRLGLRAWSVQFHPETSPEVFADWVRAEPDSTSGAAALADVTAAREALRTAWQPLAGRFLAQLT